MHGKVVVVTGATSGIGQVCAENLAAQGARVVIVARDRQRGENTLARLRIAAPGVVHTAHYADLSSIAEMKRVSAEIASAESRIDVLVNNAGALFGSRQVSVDGLELMFASNHVSYFVMAHGLRERLASAKPARIVNTSSHAHHGKLAEVTDWQSERNYSSFSTYSRSKLYNILLTRELARRLIGAGVTANAFHPGFVATRIGDNSGFLLSTVGRVAKLFALTPEQGADTQVYLASSPEVAGVTGQYFYKRKQNSPTAAAQNDETARQLWAETERLTGIKW